ncbi:MAG: MFS transporter [Chloroflexota bacterium]|jgi:DHA3 family macrolide efflux protein-like MFS transporter
MAFGWRLWADWRTNYFPMWFGQALSLIGSRIVQFALIWYLTQKTGSATVLATATLVALVPEIILSPLAGVFVDRWDRQMVMIIADGAVALASWLLAFLFWFEAVEVWHIYVIMFVRAVGGSFHWPAFQTSTSLMVPEEHMTRVNGLNQAVNGVLMILGAPLGALLLALLPVYGVMLVDVSTAVLAILPLILVNVPLPISGRAAGDEAAIFWSELLTGLRYVVRWRGLLAIIFMAMVIQIALTPAFSLLPLLVSDYFGGDAMQLGLLEAILGVGMLVGGLTLSVWGGFRRRIYTSLAGVIAMGASLLILGFVPAEFFNLALLSVFLVGLTATMVDGPIMAVLQTTVAPEIQGRVFTVTGSLIAVTSPLGLVIAGPVTDFVGLKTWYFLTGAVCIALGLLLFLVPDVIYIEERAKASNLETSRPPAVLVKRS